MRDVLERLKEFKVHEFPDREGVVYVLCLIKKDEEKEVPFYVGETEVLCRRLGEYVVAQFSAETDFKVGEAIKYFKEKGCRVVVRWEHVGQLSQILKRRREEKKLINGLMWKGYKLLNALKGFSYITADENAERERIGQFCAEIV